MVAMHNYASNEEWYWSWYLEELRQTGFISHIEYQPKPFKICDPVKISYNVQMKRKGTVQKEIPILQGSEYTADWAWWWTDKAKEIFFTTDPFKNPKDFPFFVNTKGSSYFSVVDVKGTFDPNNNVRMFAMNQKMIYKLYGIYVQAIVPRPTVKVVGESDPPSLIIKPKTALFYKTFTPQRYLRTDASGKPRKILYPVKPITQFVDEQRNKLEAVSGQV